MTTSFVEAFNSTMINNIKENIGKTVDVENIEFELSRDINEEGVWIIGIPRCLSIILNNYDYALAVTEAYLESDFHIDAICEPERFLAQMYMHYAQKVADNSQWVSEHIDQHVEITEEIANILINELKMQED